jgi:carboxyl-terminal processing protease
MLRTWFAPALAALVACSSPVRSSSPDGPPTRAVEAAAASTPAESSETALRDPRETVLAATVMALLEREHVRKRPFDDALSRDAFTIYLKRLDSGKMFLLKEDAAALEKHADRIDDQLKTGQLDLAHEGARRFGARVAVVDKMVTELLARPLDLTDDEQLQIDPEKVELAANDTELRDRWRRRLELEVIERVAGMETRLAGEAEKQPNTGKKPRAPRATPPPGASADPAPPADEDDDESETGAPVPPVGEIPATPEGREAKAREDLARAYSGRFARLRAPSALDAAADLVNAVTSAFDPHTNYLPPADKANFDIQMTGSLEGIGAVLRERDHYIEIAEIVPGGATWRQGKLSTGDLILTVAQQGKDPVDVTDMRIDEVVKMIRGPKGTVVTLRVRKSTGVEELVSITRDVVVIEESYARGALLSPGSGKEAYGYIFLPSFYGGSGPNQRTATADVRRLLQKMKERKVAGVVIDIRSNGGGFLGAAVEITGLLVDRGPVVQVRDSDGRRDVLSDRDRGVVFDGPVVVLVDRFSASASEIVAGALQDYHRAVVVGTGPTHGKGTVQSLADLDRITGGSVELGVLKLTIQQFFRVSGASTQREGIKPDIVLPDPLGHVDAGERELDHAIPWSQIEAVGHERGSRPLRTELLAARSAARVSANKVFAKVTARAQLLRTWRDDTMVPLARPAWQARRDRHKAALEATSPELDKAPARMAVTLLDDDAAKLAPGPGGKTDDRPTRWRDNLARDPWVEECLHILGDMTSALAAR